MAKMATGEFSQAAIEETSYMIKNTLAKIQTENNRGVEFPGHRQMQAELDRHLAIVRENQTARCLPCQHGTTKNLHTH